MWWPLHLLEPFLARACTLIRYGYGGGCLTINTDAYTFCIWKCGTAGSDARQLFLWDDHNQVLHNAYYNRYLYTSGSNVYATSSMSSADKWDWQDQHSIWRSRRNGECLYANERDKDGSSIKTSTCDEESQNE